MACDEDEEKSQRAESIDDSVPQIKNEIDRIFHQSRVNNLDIFSQRMENPRLNHRLRRIRIAVGLMEQIS